MTMTKIETVTLGSAQASIDFTSIPNGGLYTDLLITLSIRSNNASGNDFLNLRFNNDTGFSYAYRRLYGTGSAAGSDTNGGSLSAQLVTAYINIDGNTANTFGNASLYIPNYAGSTAKTVSVDSVNETNATTAYSSIVAGSWTGTSAITSIKLYPNNGTTLLAGSTASLYGILKGSGGATVS